MQQPLRIYNTLTRQKELFEPLAPPHVGMYVCGPTVYSHVHLGNCRTFTMFDVVARYLRHLGYKVRYVRNITDVGHLTDDADQGEDKISKKARLENLEPMEIVQQYTIDFHEVMALLNNLPPSVEPTATGHLIEQIGLVQQLLDKGLAYEANGSVYFDVKAYQAAGNDYGKLSGRVLDDLLAGQRSLAGQEEKRNPEDFALWKKAEPQHIMRWPSPWSDGFPGWHLECSAMSAKYLGQQFDIHGGGMDLKFPHHECEIAQGKGAHGHEPVRYWLHSNMLNINGQRMAKSVGNVINPRQLFAGEHELLSKAYSPMTLRFFMLQTHYRSTMDITDDALKAAEKAYFKLMNGLRIARTMTFAATDVAADADLQAEVEKQLQDVYDGLNDDFNTAVALGALFNLLRKLNSLYTGQLAFSALGEELFEKLTSTYTAVVKEVLGLKEELPDKVLPLVDALTENYREAKAKKDYEQVDKIREHMRSLGLQMKDLKTKIDWGYAE